jgi:hypothetical protein
MAAAGWPAGTPAARWATSSDLLVDDGRQTLELSALADDRTR